jgi:tRNA A-37 threonylcarbamoyl transferase component Bud32
MDPTEGRFEQVEVVGSAEFFLSADGRYFKKRVADDPETVTREYRNLIGLQEEDPVEGLAFVDPVTVVEDCLITRYVEARSLLDVPRPERYREFGGVLREFHDQGYTHSHLQFNDVLYDGNVFYLADLTSVNERAPVYDLAIPKVGLDTVRLKRPWRWTAYDRCYRAFLEGYGHDGFTPAKLERVYEEFYDEKVRGYRQESAMDWKYHTLRLARRLTASPDG